MGLKVKEGTKGVTAGESWGKCRIIAGITAGEGMDLEHKRRIKALEATERHLEHCEWGGMGGAQPCIVSGEGWGVRSSAAMVLPGH